MTKTSWTYPKIITAAVLLVVSVAAGATHVPLAKEVSARERSLRALTSALRDEVDLTPFLRFRLVDATTPIALRDLVARLDEADPRATRLRQALEGSGRTQLAQARSAVDLVANHVMMAGANGRLHAVRLPPEKPVEIALGRPAGEEIRIAESAGVPDRAVETRSDIR